MSNMYAVTGDHVFLRDRFLKDLIADHSGEGWDVSYIDGSNLESLMTALNPSMFFDSGGDLLVIVSNPEKADINILKAHMKSKDPIVVVLFYEGNPKGNTKFGKFLKTLKKTHRQFKKPNSWDLDKEAAAFCIEEAKSYGKTLDKLLASALVVVSGNDFGFLSFEIKKICMLADDTDNITVEHINGAKAALTEMDINPVVDAIAAKNTKRIISVSERLKNRSKYDPTMALIGFLTANAVKWLQVSDLKDKGITSKDAAQLLGLNPWFYENKLLPQISNWTTSDLIKLIKIIADVRRSVLSGQNNPWVVLISQILLLCR